MYHSITFDSMNTFSDWHLVPDSRPVIALPELKTSTVDVPGSAGILDLSESLTGYPLYSNRSGSMLFHVLNDVEPWQLLYSRIANYLHGKKRKVILEDDPEYYYQGRMTVTWTSNNNGTWSDVEIGYDLEPYKYYYITSIQEDPTLYKNITVNNNTKTISIAHMASIGSVPVVPEFVLSNVSSSGVHIVFTNQELNISKTVTANSSGTRKYYDMVISNMSGSNTCTIAFSGYGTVNVVFRRMAL